MLIIQKTSLVSLSKCQVTQMLLASWTISGRKHQKILEEMGASVLKEERLLDTAFHNSTTMLCFLESLNDMCCCLGLMAIVLTAAQKVQKYQWNWMPFCSTALSKYFSISFSVAAEVGISSSFCFRLLRVSCPFACNLCNSLDFQAAGIYFVLEAVQQISFLNLDVVFHDFIKVSLLKKALGKQPVVFKKWRFTEKC